jgi:hypothetical protein
MTLLNVAVLIARLIDLHHKVELKRHTIALDIEYTIKADKFSQTQDIE